MAHRNVWLPSLDLTILSILTFVREWPKASLSGRLLGLSFYRNSHKGLGMSPSNVSSHATEAPPVSGMGGRYRTLLLCAGTKLVPPCPHVHCWPPACGNTESASEWKTGGKQKWHQLSIWDDLGMVPTWLIGRQWTMLQDATGEMPQHDTATYCNHLLLNQLIPKDLQSFHAPPESRPTGGTLTAQLDSSPGVEPTAVEPHQTHLSHPIRSHQIPASFVLIWSSRL